MSNFKNICRKTLIILSIVIAIIVIGLAGQLDHDEYIEANSTPTTRMPYWYEN